MCGIFAAITPKEVKCTFAPRAVELLKHRGPNMQGSGTVRLAWANVTLGMSRLRIVDQRELFVPYVFKNGVSLAFNGEIYNWQSLRRELPGPWETNCDAEVVAKAWRSWGPGCLERFNGMWGLVLVDTLTNEVFITRDRAGEKPVYWTRAGDCLYIASEPKALPVALTEGACVEYDVLEFDCGETTTFENVYTLAPGSYFHLKSGIDDLLPTRWWELQPTPEDNINIDKATEELKELLIDAIHLRCSTEVPLAAQVSGGLDSAIVQAVCQSSNLYCVTFPADGVDNLSGASAAAPGKEIVPVSFTREDLLEELPKIAYHLDTPATWTAVCQWFMSKKIAADGNVVVLCGEGADELFGGYSRYRVLYWLERMLTDENLAAYQPLIERTFGNSIEGLFLKMIDRRRGQITDSVPVQILVETYTRNYTGDLVTRMGLFDFYTTMQVLLRMSDRMTAAFGRENRSPFFDYRVMEFSATLPSKVKVNEQHSKDILRRVARELGVSSYIVGEKTKRGFSVPSSWGNGRTWDRKWFVHEMEATWRKHVCRPALCKGACKNASCASIIA